MSSSSQQNRVKMEKGRRHINETIKPNLAITIQNLRILKILLEIHLIKYRVENKSGNNKKSFSVSKRMKFQRKMNNSQNLLEDQEKERVKCTLCHKTYQRESGLKAHIKKVHGLEELPQMNASVVNESAFEPAMTSTAEDCLDAVKKEEVGESRPDKRKRSTDSEDSLEDEFKEGEDTSENVESAKKAREARKKVREQLMVERELEMGFPEEEDEDEKDVTVKAGPSNQEPSTQDINDGLAEAIKKQEVTQVFEEPSQNSSDDGKEVAKLEVEVKNLKRMLANKDSKVLDLQVKLNDVKDQVDAKDRLLAIKDSKVMDLQVKLSEANDQLDAKDRLIKEKREVIKIKDEEIQDLEREAQEFNNRLKISPLKETLKANGIKAERKIKEQANKIKALETKVKNAENKKAPELEKLQRQVSEQLERAEHYTEEEVRLLNIIANLRKKIPCPAMPNCDQGKKCQHAHNLKYAKAEVNYEIPCFHFNKGWCKWDNEKDCGFAHRKAQVKPQNPNNRGQGQSSQAQGGGSYLDSYEDEDASIQEITPRANYARMATNNRPPSAKRSRRSMDYSGNSCATDRLPAPVPAVSREEYEGLNNNSGKGKVSGNGRGAQGMRSDLVTPSSSGSRSGPRQRGRSAGRYNSPRGRYQREEEEHPRDRWDRISDGRFREGGRRGSSSSGGRRW